MSETGPTLYEGPAENAGVVAKGAAAHRPSTNVAISRRLARIVPLLTVGGDSATHGSARQAGSVARSVYRFGHEPLGSNSSIGLPDGSSITICDPPGPLTMSFRNVSPASRSLSTSVGRSSTIRWIRFHPPGPG